MVAIKYFLLIFLIVIPKWQTEASSILMFTAFPHHYDLLLEMAFLLQSNDHHPEFLSYETNGTIFQEYQFPVHSINSTLEFPFSDNDSNIMQEAYNFELEFLHLKPILEFLVKSCPHMLNNEHLHKTLRSQNYSLLLVDLYANDVCALALARKLEIPVIGFWPRAISLPGSYLLGIPTFPSFIPATGKIFQSPLSFSERISNMLAVKAELQEWDNSFYLPLTAVLESLTPSLSVNELYGDVSIVFTNEDPVFDIIRPTLPNIIPIGGIHCQLSTPLPKYMNNFVNSFRGGVTFVHINTEIYPKLVFNETMYLLNSAFSEFPFVGFIWNDIPPDVNNNTINILAVEHVHDHDILGLSRTHLFISTCDKSSVLSALFHGVPLLCIPVTTDQWDNANRLNEKNVALFLDKRKLTKENIQISLQSLLTDKKFSESARNMSAVIREKPEAPSDLFIFWVNYIIRHKSVPHLMSSSRQMSTLQYYNADIVLAALILLFLVIVVVVSMIYLFTYLSKLASIAKRTKSE